MDGLSAHFRQILDGLPKPPQLLFDLENELTEGVIYKVGIRFEPLREDVALSMACKDSTDESFTSKCHWAIIFTTYNDPKWSFRVELRPYQKSMLTFPLWIIEGDICAHPIGAWTGYLEDILGLIQAHPMRRTTYSPAFNNCQHWAATFLILLQANTLKRKFNIVYEERYQNVLSVLHKSNTSFYHKPSWMLQGLQAVSMGGGAGAIGAAAVAAEATVTVPASGIAGWFGATVTTAAPGAAFAAAALPVAIGVSTLAASTYIYKTVYWRRKTMFADPRVHGCPIDDSPLLTVERGDFLDEVEQGGNASGDLIKKLLGSYAGDHFNAICAASCAPSTVAVVAPVAALVTTSAVMAGTH